MGVVEVREASPQRERGTEIGMSRMKQPGVSQERAGPRSWGRNEPGVLEELREACHSSSAGSEGDRRKGRSRERQRPLWVG